LQSLQYALPEIHLPKKQRIKRLTQWEPPQLGAFKFNVDGSARGSPSPIGIGGVLRNSNAEIIGIFSKLVGVCWTYEAEILAI